MPTPVLMGTLPLTVRTGSIRGKTVAWSARIVSCSCATGSRAQGKQATKANCALRTL